MLTVVFCLIAGSFLYHFFTKKITDDGCEKTVSKKDWQYRLIAWTIRAKPDFKGYCAYFWSFWLCLFLIPFTLASKVLEFVFSLWGKEAKEEAPDQLASPTDYRLGLVYHEEEWEHYYKNYLERHYAEWLKLNPNWREGFKIRLEAQKAEDEREAKKLAAQRKRAEFLQEKLAIAAKYTSWMVKPLIISCALLIAFGLFKLVMSMSSVVASTDFLWALLIVVGIFGGASLINHILRWVKSVAKVVEKVAPPIESQPAAGPSFMTKFWDVVTFPFKLAVRMYQKECPIIKYKD